MPTVGTPGLQVASVLGKTSGTVTGSDVLADGTVAAALAAKVPASASAVGYDLIAVMGQSNASGYGLTIDATGYDFTDPRVYQYPAAGQTYAGSIVQAYEPLRHPDRTSTPGIPFGVGPALTFGKLYADANPGRRVLLVPAAYQGARLVGSDWDPAVPGTFLTAAVTQVNAATAAAGAGARLAAILWVQGETDALSNVTQATYQAKLVALIAYLRANLTGGSATPFLIGSMVPGWTSTPNGTSTQIAAAHAAIPAAVTRTAYVVGPSGQSQDSGGIHYNAAGARALGKSMFDALATASANV